MVQAVIKISDDANRILNVVKAKYGLKDKSQAIERVVLDYGHDLLEPELRPEFVARMNERQGEKTIAVEDFDTHFGI